MRATEPIAAGRPVLRERLEARREEIEAAALIRVKAISDPADIPDPAYAAGLRDSVEAAISYGLEAVESDGVGEPPIPEVLLGQARLAARHGVSLDTVLRRYFAGFSIFSHFILEEAGREGRIHPAEPQRLLDAHTANFDRLLVAIGAEHTRETRLHGRSSKDEQAAQVERLLAGGMVGSVRLDYDLAAWHIGVVARGSRAERVIRDAARALDIRFLCISRVEGTVWGWFGARRRLDPADLMRHLSSGPVGKEFAISLGEAAEGLAGWRLTHRQAASALTIAERTAQRAVRYRDVALLASVDRDELLSASLRHIYLEPLERGREGGALLRLTIRAYFGAQFNLTSAAAAMGVSRQTVHNRLRVAEEFLERPLYSCVGDLSLALKLAELNEAQAYGSSASHID